MINYGRTNVMNYYLNRYAYRTKIIQEEVNPQTGIIVVIPCHNEPDLVSALLSLYDCKQPNCKVEVIVVINASENAEEAVLKQNQTSYDEAIQWCATNFGELASALEMTFHFIQENSLPKKHAGVGLARKIGMDEAVRRFAAIDCHNGVISCYDADASCEPNYLVELEKHFKENPKSPACSIHFEHPISGEEFSPEIYNGIMQYELHLRYYKNGLADANLPFAFHTIGSSMAVRSNAYQKQNGMNKRKAGEDFYFLQKLIPLGNFTELKTTKIIPSPRVSDRVPFGTGKAMQSWLNDAQEELLSYHPKSFIELRLFAAAVPKLYEDINEIPATIQAFLETIDFEENLINIKKNSKSAAHFSEVFFKWFNAFKVLKFMHFSRDQFFPDVPIFEGANELLAWLTENKEGDLKGLLAKYRKIDSE
jgi:glycosyltransferase involved in cell wall biosynthesis